MAFVLPPAPSAFPGRRLAQRRRGIDWRVVALTAASTVLLIAMMGRPV